MRRRPSLPFTAFLVLLITVAFSSVRVLHAQTPMGSPSDSTHKAAIDTTLSSTPKPAGKLWRRPQVQRNGGDDYFSAEAMRYYGSPTTLPNLLEESGSAFPLVLSDEAYGRESFLLTPRTSEGLSSSLIDGVLPTNSILNGTSLSSYFPLEPFSSIRFNAAAEGMSNAGADISGSDALDHTIERFRAPVPYSRLHYTQDLSRSNSVFDGLFSLNVSRATNFALAVHRHASGHPINVNDLTFNPRTDLWSVRGQLSIEKYLGSLPKDSTMTAARIDSILATPKARQKTLDFLLWSQYTTAFNGLNGGVAAFDSSDVFDQVSARVHDLNTFDHRVRIDGLAELELPLLATARTKIAAFASYESRRILSRDSTFPAFIPELSTGSRMGAMLEQPLDLTIGSFTTAAKLRGDFQRIAKDSTSIYGQKVSETRLAATASDSLALRTALRVSLFGFARAVESNLSIGGGAAGSDVLPSVGFSGSVGLSDAVSFSASYGYSKDRATLSPTPQATYQLRNIGGWMDARFGWSGTDSIAIHAGLLDRHEPEGIVYDSLSDTAFTPPRFSSSDLHTWSATIALDAYFSRFHWSSSFTYFPSTVPLSPYAATPALRSDLKQRLFGYAGVYYENQAGEGNLRLSVGPRARLLSLLDPALSYDPASDYYVYRGSAYSMMTIDSVTRALRPLPDKRVTAPKVALDVLLSAEVDRRAQISMSFLNILSAPYYNVALYPRDGFHWRFDVVWAFID